jgi:hypothetical protein
MAALTLPSPSPLITSTSDTRAYRYVTLPRNHLRCVIVSDPAADKAAAAMSVRTACWFCSVGFSLFVLSCFVLVVELQISS